MLVHTIIIVTVLIAVLCRKNKYILILPFFTLIMFSVLRYEYGNDYTSYLSSYQLIHSGYQLFNNEQAFYYLNRIMPSFQLMISAISVLYLVLVYILIIKNVDKKYYFVSMFLLLFNPYVFLMSLSNIRQTLAICLFIVAVNFIYKRKLIPYVAIVLLASLIHNSAILLLPVYFIASSKPLRKRTIYITIIGVSVLLLSPTIIYELISYVLSFFDNNNYSSYFNAMVGSSIYSLIFAAILFLYVILNINKLSDKQMFYSKLYLISTILGLLAFKLNMLGRVQEYFELFSIVAIPSIMYAIKQNNGNNDSRILNLLNKTAFPVLIFLIFIIKYLSFYNNPLWSSFFDYKIIP